MDQFQDDRSEAYIVNFASEENLSFAPADEIETVEAAPTVGFSVSNSQSLEHNAKQRNGQASASTLEATLEQTGGSKGCLSCLLAHLPAASIFALGLMLGGLILFVTGFFLTRQELGYYVRQHQPRSEISFDTLFPSLLYWICGVSAGLLVYSLLHYAINASTSAMAAKNMKGSRDLKSKEMCVKAIVVLILGLDALLIACTGLMSCAAFLVLYAQVMFAARLQLGVTQFELSYYLTAKIVSPGLAVDAHAGDETATATSFPMFYPSLALFIGLCLTEASLIMSLTFLAINSSKLALPPTRRCQQRRRGGVANGGLSVDDGLEGGQERSAGLNTQL